MLKISIVKQEQFKMTEKIDYELLNTSYKELADLVGVDNMLKIHDNFCGTQLQLPMRLYDPKAVKKMIQKETLTDEKIRKLSLKYGFSPRWFKQ